MSKVRLRAAGLLLADGASYREVSRTLRMDRQTLKRHFPGYEMTREQSIELNNLARKLRSL